MAENHALYLGKLIGNLQSLEVLLRFYHKKLQEKHDPKSVFHSDYWELAVGDIIPEDAFSNYDTLGKLVSKFNGQIGRHDSLLVIDTNVVGIRDLLAHGRVSAESPDPKQLKIVKFSSPTNGTVTVVATAVMSEAWFESNITLVREQLDKIARAIARYAT